MDANHLIRMANRIAEFFAAMPDHREAVDGVADHLRKFWEPRMLTGLRVYLEQNGTQELHPLVAEAVAGGVLDGAGNEQ